MGRPTLLPECRSITPAFPGSPGTLARIHVRGNGIPTPLGVGYPSNTTQEIGNPREPIALQGDAR